MTTDPKLPIETEFAAMSIPRMALISACGLAVLAILGLTMREVMAASHVAQFAEVISFLDVMLFAVTMVAIPKQEICLNKSWTNFWAIFALVVSIATLPISTTWASNQALGLSPSLLPGLTIFLCLALPFCVPNQTLFGIGSLVPKMAFAWMVMHYHENTDLGIYAANNLSGVQTSLAAMALFCLVFSVVSVPFRIRLSPWLMFILGVILPFPCMIKIEIPLVVFHVL